MTIIYKRIATVLFGLVLILSIAGCGMNTDLESNEPDMSAPTATSSLEVQVKPGLMIEAYEAIDLDFLWPEKIPAKYDLLSGSSLEAALISDYGSIEQYINSLGDKYTRYYAPGTDPTDAKLGNESYVGIGVYIKEEEGIFKVLYVIPDGPAKAAGLRDGDLITEVNDSAVNGLKLEEVVNLIRGDAGTTVKIKVSRATESLEFSIVRQPLTAKSVYSETKEGNIGYLRLIQFGYNAHSEFNEAYNALSAETTGLIIDLRANGGGEFYNSLDIAAEFVPEGKTLLWYRDKTGVLEEFTSYSGDKISLPVILLVNSDSASASEILTAALMDNGVAVSVGEKTHGKGTVQIRKTLSDSSHLYITCAEYLSPNKQPINEIGITPNNSVEITDADIASGNDPQLTAAINEIKTKQTTSTFSLHTRPKIRGSSMPKRIPKNKIDHLWQSRKGKS